MGFKVYRRYCVTRIFPSEEEEWFQNEAGLVVLWGGGVRTCHEYGIEPLGDHLPPDCPVHLIEYTAVMATGDDRFYLKLCRTVCPPSSWCGTG